MKTSPSQFEVMVDFMERNGDLNKPCDGPSGRLRAISMWEELTNALNLDMTGTAKPVEKWKKVWSDFKNNTKRKAAKIHRAASGTDGGPACKLTLTDQEQRVLNIIGPQAATGLLLVDEVGLEVSLPRLPAELTGGLPKKESPTPTNQDIVVKVESITEDLNSPGAGGQSITQPFHEMVEASATPPSPNHCMSPPRTRRARRLFRSQASAPPYSARRPRRQNIAEQLLISDERWRNLATQFVTENLRLREIELQQQSQWQTLFAKLIDLMALYENKLNK